MDPNFIPNLNFAKEAVILHITVASIRPQLLHCVIESINRSEPHGFNVFLHVFFHGKVLDPHGCQRATMFYDSLTGDLTRQWIFSMCDDNMVHPAMLRRLSEEIEKRPDAQLFVFNQERHDSLAPGLTAAPENMRPGRVDVSSVAFRADALGKLRPELSPINDGVFFQTMYESHKDRTVFLNETLSYFEAAWWYMNGQEKRQVYKLSSMQNFNQ